MYIQELKHIYVTFDDSNVPWYHIIWYAILRSYVAITTEYACLVEKQLYFSPSHFFFDLKNLLFSPPDIVHNMA
jgi:hypothetical protein